MNSNGDPQVVSTVSSKIRRILVPVDYSECSIFACRYAVKIACKLSAELKLFHTFYSPAFDLIELAGAVQTQSQLREEVTVNLEESERNTMEQFMKSIQEYVIECSMPSVSISYDIVPGVPEDEIVTYSQSYQPDLIVMGTKGKGTGVGSIIGSVTAAVSSRINYPVLAIPEKYIFIGEQNVKNLLYVTEFDESDFVTLKSLINIADQLEVSIQCVHIGSNPKAWDKVRMEGLMKYFSEAYGKSNVTYSFINEKNLIMDLDALIREKNINILSLTAHRKGILNKLFKVDLAKKLVYHTSIPLLIFH